MKEQKKCLDCGVLIYHTSIRCRRCAAKLGTRIRTKDILQRENIVAMYASGLSTKEIGTKVGLTAGAVYSLLKHRGVKLRTVKESLRLRYPNGRRGPRSGNWKGGRRKHGSGYIQIFKPDHPNVGNSGYIMEHRLVMEEHLGRYIKPTEYVHHINGEKSDNRLENLELMPHRAAHVRTHFRAVAELDRVKTENQKLKDEIEKYKELFGEVQQETL